MIAEGARLRGIAAADRRVDKVAVFDLIELYIKPVSRAPKIRYGRVIDCSSTSTSYLPYLSAQGASVRLEQHFERTTKVERIIIIIISIMI